MALDLGLLAVLLGAGVSFSALLSPVLKLHSRLDLLSYRIEHLEASQERLYRKLYSGVDEPSEKG